MSFLPGDYSIANQAPRIGASNPIKSAFALGQILAAIKGGLPSAKVAGAARPGPTAAQGRPMPPSAPSLPQVMTIDQTTGERRPVDAGGEMDTGPIAGTQGGFWSRLWKGLNDPANKASMLTFGSTMMQPPTMGQNSYGKLGEALVGAYNTKGAYKQAQMKSRQEADDRAWNRQKEADEATRKSVETISKANLESAQADKARSDASEVLLNREWKTVGNMIVNVNTKEKFEATPARVNELKANADMVDQLYGKGARFKPEYESLIFKGEPQAAPTIVSTEPNRDVYAAQSGSAGGWKKLSDARQPPPEAPKTGYTSVPPGGAAVSQQTGQPSYVNPNIPPSAVTGIQNAREGRNTALNEWKANSLKDNAEELQLELQRIQQDVILSAKPESRRAAEQSAYAAKAAKDRLVLEGYQRGVEANNGPLPFQYNQAPASPTPQQATLSKELADQINPNERVELSDGSIWYKDAQGVVHAGEPPRN